MKLPGEFWSIENMTKHVDEIYSEMDMTVVDVKMIDDCHKMICMVDPAGRGWYETKVLRSGNWVSQEEAIFGKRNGKRRPV